MSYDYVNYRRRQYDLPQPTQPFRPYQPVQPRRATCWDPPDRRPTCWDPPGNRPLPSFQPYDPPQSRQSSYWELPPRRASRGYSDYDQPPVGPPSRWDPPGQRIDRCHLDLQPQKSYARYSSWQPQIQPGPATTTKDSINAKLDRLLEVLDRMDTRVDVADRQVSKFQSSQQPDLDRPYISSSLRKMEYLPSRNTMVSSVPSGLPPNVSSAPPRHRTIEYTNCRSDLQSLQRSSMTSHCHSVAPPPVAAVVLSSNLPQPAPSCSPDDDGLEEGGSLDELPPPTVISPPCSPYIMGEDETLLDDEEEVDSIEEVKKVVASLDVARVTSQDVIENCVVENGDLHDSDVARMIHQPTLLAIDARLILPRNSTTCLGIRGRVDKLHVLHAFDPGICVSFGKRKYGFLAMQMEKSDLRESEKELPLKGVIKCLFAAAETFRIELHMLAKHVVFTNARKFNGYDEGKRSAARCVFDPGGDALQKLLLSTIVVASWFPP